MSIFILVRRYCYTYWILINVFIFLQWTLQGDKKGWCLKKGEFLTLSVLAHAQKSKGSMTNGKAGFDNILNVFTRRGASWPSGEASALHPTEQMRFVRVGVNWSMFINEFVTICIQHIKFSETVQYFRFFFKFKF